MAEIYFFIGGCSTQLSSLMLHILRLLACGEGAVLLRKHSVSLKNVQLSSLNFNVEGDGGKQRLKHSKLVMLTCPLQQKFLHYRLTCSSLD